MDRDAGRKSKGELPIFSHMLITHGSQVAIKCLRNKQVEEEKAKRVGTYILMPPVLMWFLEV
jgi:hypothetical protein